MLLISWYLQSKALEKSSTYGNEFGSRWRKEFLRILQERKTCKTRRRNFRNEDIVLLKAENHRNHWPIARIIETFEDKHGVVRIVRLKLGSENNAQRELVRPIAKIVLLVEGDSPMESQGLHQNQALILRGARWNEYVTPNFDGSQMKRVRDNQPDETSTWQRVRDSFSHMRPLKYIYHYV